MYMYWLISTNLCSIYMPEEIENVGCRINFEIFVRSNVTLQSNVTLILGASARISIFLMNMQIDISVKTKRPPNIDKKPKL